MTDGIVLLFLRILIRFSGLMNTKVCLLSRVSVIGLMMVEIALIFFQSPFQTLEHPKKCSFLLGKLLKGRSPQRMCLKEEILTVLIDALCLEEEEKWIIFLFIVVGFNHFGILLFP